MKRLLVTVFVTLLSAGNATAGQLEMIAGPPSVGNGGSNPLSIPPGAQDLQFNYLGDKDSEWTISILPGIFYGTRQMFDIYYVSIGGGLAIDGNGIGPGIDAGFGISVGKTWLFIAEYRQAIGYDFSEQVIINPYALRMGAGVRF